MELVALRAQWSGDETIYAAAPWQSDAEAIGRSAARSDATGNAQWHSLRLLLETSIARDFIVDLIAYSSKHAKSERTICERLIRYAIDDA